MIYGSDDPTVAKITGLLALALALMGCRERPPIVDYVDCPRGMFSHPVVEIVSRNPVVIVNEYGGRVEASAACSLTLYRVPR